MGPMLLRGELESTRARVPVPMKVQKLRKNAFDLDASTFPLNTITSPASTTLEIRGCGFGLG